MDTHKTVINIRYESYFIHYNKSPGFNGKIA